eukprot:COSAG02_NODE_5991_length_3886_cov_2.197254_1_plen_299_part_00
MARWAGGKVPVTLVLIMWCAVGAFAGLANSLTPAEVLCLGTLAVSWPGFILCDQVGYFIPELGCAVAKDRVREATKRVQASTPTTADYDRLLADIIDAEAFVSSLSKFLAHATKVGLGVSVLFGCLFIFIGLSGVGPPSDLDVGWNTYHWPQIFLGVGMVLIILAVYTLVLPATVTSACEELMDAINKMREAKAPGELSARMPPNICETEASIDYLLQYVKNLNRRRGMGFTLHRKRISHSFVLSLGLKAVSFMPIFFAVMLSFTKVETEEQAIQTDEEMMMNVTRERCVALLLGSSG